MPVQTKEEILHYFSLKRDFLFSKYHVEELGLFGSFVHNEQVDDSDVDILVVFRKEGLRYLNYLRLKNHFEEVFDRKVDLVIKSDIKKQLKNQIIREAIYA